MSVVSIPVTTSENSAFQWEVDIPSKGSLTLNRTQHIHIIAGPDIPDEVSGLELSLSSESSLAEVWLNPDEDRAWQDL